ncbi:PREDICTED: pentatricopeptide repeat-containing, partial [Prunus dulcis]
DENPIQYVDECYKPETYMRSYQTIVHPISSMDPWVKGGLPPIRPPFHRRQLGRPKRVRTKEPAEVQ